MDPLSVRTKESYSFCDLYLLFLFLLNGTCLCYGNAQTLQLSALSSADPELQPSCTADDGLGLLSLHLPFFSAAISTPRKATDVSILQDGII